MELHDSKIQIFREDLLATKLLELNLNGFGLFITATDREKELTFESGSIFLFVQRGKIEVCREGSQIVVGFGHYMCGKSSLTIKLHPNTYLILVQTPSDQLSLNMTGGPIESEGRLRYIDNCSDTLLLPPAVLGDPCLNFLHFPANTKQTSHYHPSFRFGIVARGSGLCVEGKEHSSILNAGDVFLIPANVMHCFLTADSEMDVIAFHPDSDWGPTNNNHPMINRTWVNGKKIGNSES